MFAGRAGPGLSEHVVAAIAHDLPGLVAVNAVQPVAVGVVQVERRVANLRVDADRLDPVAETHDADHHRLDPGDGRGLRGDGFEGGAGAGREVDAPPVLAVADQEATSRSAESGRADGRGGGRRGRAQGGRGAHCSGPVLVIKGKARPPNGAEPEGG